MAIKTAKDAKEFVLEYVRLLHRIDQYDVDGQYENMLAAEIAILFKEVEDYDTGAINEEQLVGFMEMKRETTFKAVNTGHLMGKFS